MNKILNRLERKFGKYAVRNLTLYIIIAYVIGYILAMTGTLEVFMLNPYSIIEKYQVWRLLTWVFVPPGSLGIFTILMLYVYYQLGSILERQWGAFRYNLYIFSGILFSVIGAFILYVYYAVFNGVDPGMAGMYISTGFSTAYINMSIFLAFAAMFPDMQMLLFFVIPIKIKWLAFVDVAMMAYQFIYSSQADRIAIVMSLLNFILFFFGYFDFKRISPKEIRRRNAFKRAVRGVRHGSSYKYSTGAHSSSVPNRPAGMSKHHCAICKRTENDSDNLEFRFCSKCNGNYEYCSDHLFTHEHVK